MKHIFDYYYVATSQGQFEIDDISNFTLNLINDFGREWYIDTSTLLGNTIIVTAGPLLIDSENLEDGFEFKYNKFIYSEKKIISFVKKILNNSKNCISQVEYIERDIFLERLNQLDIFNY